MFLCWTVTVQTLSMGVGIVVSLKAMRLWDMKCFTVMFSHHNTSD
jgi:hypothetical protein